MKKILLFIGILILSFFLFSSSNYKVKKDFKILPNEYFKNSIVSIGGKIDIKGKIGGSVILIGGSLKLDGKVEEDVICFASKIEVSKNALVEGDFIAIGGKLNRDAKNCVKGDYFYSRFNLKKIESTILPILSDSKSITFVKTTKIILWFIIALIVFAIVPKKVNLAEDIFEKNVSKVGAIGILTVFSFIFLFLVFIIMSFVVIGIPFLFVLVIVYFVTYIFGRTVMLYFIGLKISNYLNIKNITPAIFIVLGIIFYSILKFLPIMGPIFLVIMNIFEIGIGITYFLKKKLQLSGYSEIE